MEQASLTKITPLPVLWLTRWFLVQTRSPMAKKRRKVFGANDENKKETSDENQDESYAALCLGLYRGAVAIRLSTTFVSEEEPLEVICLRRATEWIQLSSSKYFRVDDDGELCLTPSATSLLKEQPNLYSHSEWLQQTCCVRMIFSASVAVNQFEWMEEGMDFCGREEQINIGSPAFTLCEWKTIAPIVFDVALGPVKNLIEFEFVRHTTVVSN